MRGKALGALLALAVAAGPVTAHAQDAGDPGASSTSTTASTSASTSASTTTSITAEPEATPTSAPEETTTSVTSSTVTSSTADPAASVPDERPAPTATPPAPAGFAARLAGIYHALDRIVDDAVGLGVPAVADLDPSTFDAKLAEVSSEDLAELYHSADGVQLLAAEANLHAIEAVTSSLPARSSRDGGSTEAAAGDAPPDDAGAGPTTSATAGADEGMGDDADEATMGPLLRAMVEGGDAGDGPEASNRVATAGVVEVPAIEPSPPPYEAVPPVEATETLTCPELPPGPFVGNFLIFEAKVVRIALSAVHEALPDDKKISIPLIGPDPWIQFPNPLKASVGIVVEAATIMEAVLTYLRDIYWDCGGIDMFRQAYALDNISQHLYALLTQADGTASGANGGLVTVSGQVEQLQESTETAVELRVNRALAQPLDSAPNVAFMLPAAEGGYLDALPVGVQGIVSAALDAAQRSGLPVNSAAPLYLRMADQALIEGQYARAYVLYQKTYQHLGR